MMAFKYPEGLKEGAKLYKQCREGVETQPREGKEAEAKLEPPQALSIHRRGRS